MQKQKSLAVAQLLPQMCVMLRDGSAVRKYPCEGDARAICAPCSVVEVRSPIMTRANVDIFRLRGTSTGHRRPDLQKGGPRQPGPNAERKKQLELDPARSFSLT